MIFPRYDQVVSYIKKRTARRPSCILLDCRNSPVCSVVWSIYYTGGSCVWFQKSRFGSSTPVGTTL